jgi:hypothetical protein
MFEKTNVVELFPTHIWVHDLERSKAASICKKVLAQVEKRMPPVDEMSGGHSVQSRTQMQNDPAFGDLMECVDKAAQDVLLFLGKKGESLVAFNLMFGRYSERHSRPKFYRAF